MKLFLILWAFAWTSAFVAAFFLGEVNGAIWAFEYVDQSGVCD